MENSHKQRNKARKARVMRVRKKLRGTQARPRLTVVKTNKHLYAQLIDDEAGVTLKGFGTLGEGYKSLAIKGRMDAAKHIGAQIAGFATESGISGVIFDRGFRKYHGVIKALADSAREAGLKNF